MSVFGVQIIKTEHARKQRRAGTILIFVLIVTASLTVVAFSLAYRCQIELRLAGSSSRQTQLQYLAYGGIQRSLALLSAQELAPRQTLNVAHFFSSAQKEDLLTVNGDPEEDTTVFYWITDEYSYLSINHSDPSCWEKTELLDRSQIAGVLDWIDTDDQANPDGAESDYYQRLEAPLVCKNAPLLAAREMLHIRDISPNGYAAPFAPVFRDLPANTDLASFQSAVFQNTRSIPLYFSAHGDGKININTAGLPVLSVLQGLSESTANTILAYRAGPDRQLGTEDDNCCESNSDIAKIEGLTELESELLGQYCCFNSDMFRIYSCAKDKSLLLLLMATVKIIEDNPSIVSIERIL